MIAFRPLIRPPATFSPAAAGEKDLDPLAKHPKRDPSPRRGDVGEKVPKADERARQKAVIILAVAFIAAPLLAQSVAVTPAGTIVAAHDGVIELYSPDAKTRIWRARGVTYSGAIAIGEKELAVLDPFENRAVIVDLASGTPRPLRTAETPIAAVFAGRDLYVLDRDARLVEKIGPADGARATVTVEPDPISLKARGDKLYVYSRTAGALQEITLPPFAVSRSTTVLPFASDFGIAGDIAYLVYPSAQRGIDLNRIRPGPMSIQRLMRERGSLLAVDLDSMEPSTNAATGAVPVGIALDPARLRSSATTIFVADPSSKRIWTVAARESLKADSTSEGIVRMKTVAEVSFDSAVDRVSINGSSRLAFDSGTGTLYGFSRKKTAVLARGVAPNAWTAIPGGAAWWQNGTLVAQKENR